MAQQQQGILPDALACLRASDLLFCSSAFRFRVWSRAPGYE